MEEGREGEGEEAAAAAEYYGNARVEPGANVNVSQRRHRLWDRQAIRSAPLSVCADRDGTHNIGF